MSCGCVRKDKLRKQATTHGLTVHNRNGTPEYAAWRAMKHRCSKNNGHCGKNYSQRGIKVCRRWEVLENFISDMGPIPEKGYTLERIDNNKGYSPSNCKWATRKEQNDNRRPWWINRPKSEWPERSKIVDIEALKKSGGLNPVLIK